MIDNANWYDNVKSLAVSGGNFTLATTLGTKTLVVYAIREGDLPFVAPNADLDFTSGTPAKATVSLHGGLVQGVATGTTLINVAISAVPTVNAESTCTVP